MMRKIALIALCLAALPLAAQVKYEDYFTNNTLRFDYNRCGTAKTEQVSFQQLKQEGKWSGPRTRLIDPAAWGEYRVEVYDQATKKLVYSRGYAGLYSEWQTTEEAKTTNRCFYESVLIPYPKKPVSIQLFSRDRKTKLVKVFEYAVDPASYFISKEAGPTYKSYMVHDSGDPSVKADVVFLPDGFTADEMDKFRDAVKTFSKGLLDTPPFAAASDRFNCWLVEAPSAESGTDIPGKGVYKNTLLGTSFYTFDSERYNMTYDIKSVRDVAASVPYDIIIILVNSEKYGGGGVYNYYGCFTAFNKQSVGVFIHEFGHTFTWLADEYYTSDVAYQDYVDMTVEPIQPNVTNMVDFGKKWKKMIKPGTPVPTPRKPEFDGILGAYEGGLYTGKGIYSPMAKCKMNWLGDPFCPVCTATIKQMIDYYTK
jgi:hypothetical protein